MKQFAFVVECVIQDNSELFIIRNASNGQILKTASTPSEVASFLNEAIITVKSQIASHHD